MSLLMPPRATQSDNNKKKKEIKIKSTEIRKESK